MSLVILFCAIVILSCIVTNKFSSKLGMPALMFFMFSLVALIKRNNEYFVPNGNSKILLGDTVIFYEI